jgi:hypothetical protein
LNATNTKRDALNINPLKSEKIKFFHPLHPISAKALFYLRFPDFAACPSDKNSMKINMSMQCWWNDSEGKTKYSKKNLTRCRFAQHKSHTDLSGGQTRVSAVTFWRFKALRLPIQKGIQGVSGGIFHTRTSGQRVLGLFTSIQPNMSESGRLRR